MSTYLSLARRHLCLLNRAVTPAVLTAWRLWAGRRAAGILLLSIPMLAETGDDFTLRGALVSPNVSEDLSHGAESDPKAEL
jgi:hypothetical protein